MVTKSSLSTTCILRAIDAIIAVVTMAGSFVLRLDAGPALISFARQALAAILIALVVKPVVYHFAGLYRPYWAYMSLREALLIPISVTSSSLSVAAITLALQASGLLGAFPRSVFGIDWLLTLGCITGLRLLAHSRLKARQSRLQLSRRL